MKAILFLPIEVYDIGRATPVPNIAANALSFKTLKVTLVRELPTNFGCNEEVLLLSQIA